MSLLSVWKKEKWRITAAIFAVSFATIISISLWFRAVPLTVSAVAPRVQNVVDSVLASRKAETLLVDDVPFGDKETVNVLVLGIDSRKEGKEQHCDAIHMVSINTKSWTVLVTSVPRGTYAYIPPGNYADNEYYLANACGFAGLDYGVSQIERIVGVKADYVVTAGFSQVLGILRTLELPTTESLQWLRTRQAYAIGDPQRSQNQAVFLKDVAMKLLADDGIPDVIFHLLFTFVDSDMDYATARALYDGLLVHHIHDRPDDVVLTMKPYYDVQDLHFDPANASAQITKLLAPLEGRLSSFDLSHRTITEIQSDLINYLTDVIAGKTGTIDDVISQKLWLQVEDSGQRESFHYQFIEVSATTLNLSNHTAAIQLVADYILEKQTLGLLVWETKGRALLTTLIGK
ncbi:MAG: hypothetical protein QX199_04455 [Methylococcaceae bacterium]